jgi:ABC-type antimicrobial peptide transport system permease subunit
VVRQALVPAAFGGGVGLLGAGALANGLGGLFFEVRSFDPLTLGCAAALLVALAALASDGPARRAARVDPVAALRAE